MPIAEVAGAQLRYELGGDGPPAVLTPGGRLGFDDVASLFAELRPHLRLLGWDRRNAGRSDLWLGSTSEQTRWADDLAELLVQLDLAPAWLLGGSAGARVSYLTAMRHPEVVRGLVLWSVSGGHWGAQHLGFSYHVPYVEAALRGGMAEVAATPFYAARLADHPRNAAALAAVDPADYVASLRTWSEDFHLRPDQPVLAATAAELAAIAAPTLVFEGNDLIHPAQAAEALHRAVAGSVLAPSPWTGEEFTDRFVGRAAGTVMELYPRLVPTIVGFTTGQGGGAVASPTPAPSR